MKNDLIIIGAGNMGGFLALNQNLFKEKFNIIGFLDDDEAKLKKYFYGFQVLGKINDLRKYKNMSVVVGISNPKIKNKIINTIGKGYNFPNFISNNSWISNRVTIGKGVIIYPNVSINLESEIGDFVVINMNCALGHNTIINDYCSLAPGVNFAGFTYLEPLVDIGIGVCTIQNIKVGSGSVIGGQTMLIKNIPAEVTVVGNPGRIIK